jgi:hypothetical protein
MPDRRLLAAAVAILRSCRRGLVHVALRLAQTAADVSDL